MHSPLPNNVRGGVVLLRALAHGYIAFYMNCARVVDETIDDCIHNCTFVELCMPACVRAIPVTLLFPRVKWLYGMTSLLFLSVKTRGGEARSCYLIVVRK